MSGWERPLAVLGAGSMGRGIAYSAAITGCEVRLLDASSDQLDDAIVEIDRDLEGGIDRGKVTNEQAELARQLITVTTDLAVAVDDAGTVIEAVIEDPGLKQRLLADAQRGAAPGALIASNTSALSITELIAALPDPSRGVGMHFFNPVPRMKLCELIRGLQTAPDTMDDADAVAQRLGKETIWVEDGPGFATSRLNAILGNEALLMLQEGVASAEDIDRGARMALNHPMGPLEMIDLVGLDVRFAVLRQLQDRLGDRYRPTPLHHKLIAAGRLGRKAGHGIYRYQEGVRADEPSDVSTSAPRAADTAN